MSDLTGTQFRLLYAGSVGSLTAMSHAIKALMPASDDPFPPWQGMQYLASMFSGDARTWATSTTTGRQAEIDDLPGRPGAAPAAKQPT